MNVYRIDEEGRYEGRYIIADWVVPDGDEIKAMGGRWESDNYRDARRSGYSFSRSLDDLASHGIRTYAHRQSALRARKRIYGD